MIVAQRETGPAISFGASLLSLSLRFLKSICFSISQNNVFRNVLNLSSLIF